MSPFKSVLLTIFCLFYLQSAKCAVVDGHVQLNRFVRQGQGKKSGKDQPTKEPLAEENLSNDEKGSGGESSYRPKREKLQSKYDLLHSIYTGYLFNWHFESFSLRDASSERYTAIKDSFSGLINEILDANQLPVLASNPGQIWQALNVSLVESFENERGVIVYDQDFFRWVYCGWLTFGSDNFRICAPLLPLGLEDITRNAVKDSDYIPKDTVKYLHEYVGKLWPTDYTNTVKLRRPRSKWSNNREHGLLAGVRKVISKLLTVRDDYTLVELFVSTAETYNQRCLDDNVDSKDCAPICCYSTYIGSSFCTEHPMNCIYFGG